MYEGAIGSVQDIPKSLHSANIRISTLRNDRRRKWEDVHNTLNHNNGELYDHEGSEMTSVNTNTLSLDADAHLMRFGSPNPGIGKASITSFDWQLNETHR